jgi:hypothetical protein
MSFVTTQPDALTFAASKLEGIGSSLASQNASAAAPTTGVAPAAADEVSALQAAQFSAYGNLYQQLSAQATAINQAFVQMLGTSANSYGATETANSAATSAAVAPITLGFLGGISPLGQGSQFGQFGIIPGAITNGSLIGLNMGANAGSAYLSAANSANSSGGDSSGGDSSGGDAEAPATPEMGAGDLAGFSLASATGPAGVGAAGAAGVGAAPVLAGMGQAPAVGGLSVPPSWAAGNAVPAVSSAPATLTGAGWTSAAPHAAPVTTVPGGVPSMASAGKASGLGVPRYGVKPTVMPKPKIV